MSPTDPAAKVRPGTLTNANDTFFVEDGRHRIRVVRSGKKQRFVAHFHRNGHEKRPLKTASIGDAKRMAYGLLEKLSTGTYQGPIKPIGIWDAIDKFLASCEADGSPQGTLANYKSALRAFGRHLIGKGMKSIGQVTALAHDSYLQSRPDLSLNTRRRHAVINKTFFNFLLQRRLITANPLANLTIPRKLDTKYPAVTEDQLQNIFSCIDGEFKDIVKTAAWTGMRISELLQLQIEQIDLEQRVISIEPTKYGRLKTPAANRKIPIHLNLDPVLQRVIGNRAAGYLFANPPVVPGARLPALRWKCDAVNNLFKKAAASLGYRVGLKNVGLTFHALRRYFDTKVLDSLVPQQMADGWMGHATNAVRRAYYDSDQARQKMDAVSFAENAKEVNRNDI